MAVNLDKFNAVIQDIEEGMSLRKSCKRNSISSRTFYEWIDEDEELKKRYVRACEDRAEAIMDEAYEIADDNRNDTKLMYDKNGNEIELEDKEWTNRSKLRVDLRKWHLAKLQPKKYGDKIDVTSGGEKIEMPLFPDVIKKKE